MNKGDIVLVKAQTMGHRKNYNQRALWTFSYSKPKKGIVVGYSFIRTGQITNGSNDPYDYDPGYLTNITDNKVWLVELLEKGNRYLKPIAALEKDIEVIE